MDVRNIGRISRFVSPLPPPLVPTFRSLRPLVRPRFDANFGGGYQLVGTTKITGTPAAPVRVRVSLHDQLTGLLVRSQWSDPLTGAYKFDFIKFGVYYVVAFDHLKNYRAVIADQLELQAMP